MVGEAGIEPASPHGERILSPSCMPIPPLARRNAESPAENAGKDLYKQVRVKKRIGGGTRIRTVV